MSIVFKLVFPVGLNSLLFSIQQATVVYRGNNQGQAYEESVCKVFTPMFIHIEGYVHACAYVQIFVVIPNIDFVHGDAASPQHVGLLMSSDAVDPRNFSALLSRSLTHKHFEI